MRQMKRTSSPGIYVRSEQYFLDKIVQGTRISETLGPTSSMKLRDAEQVLAKRTTAVLDHLYAPHKRHRSLTVSDILSDHWEDHAQYLVGAKSCIETCHRNLKRLIGGMRALDLNPTVAEKYARARWQEKVRGNGWPKPKSKHRKGKPKPKVRCVGYRTVEAELQQLHMALNWQREQDRTFVNPMTGYHKLLKRLKNSTNKTESKDRAPIVLDDGKENGEEWRTLYKAADVTLKPKILVLYETGMRTKEMLALRWSWVDLVNRVIRLPGIDNEERITKSGKAREVPISRRLQKTLAAWDQDHELLFHSPDGLTVKGIRKAFDGAVRRSGIPRITPHVLRKTRTTIWNRKDELACRAAVGHDDEETHRRSYVKVTEDRLYQLVAA